MRIFFAGAARTVTGSQQSAPPAALEQPPKYSSGNADPYPQWTQVQLLP